MSDRMIKSLLMQSPTLRAKQKAHELNGQKIINMLQTEGVNNFLNKVKFVEEN
jgi:hypothetical protein